MAPSQDSAARFRVCPKFVEFDEMANPSSCGELGEIYLLITYQQMRLKALLFK